MTFGIMTLSITIKDRDTQRNDSQHNNTQFCYAEGLSICVANKPAMLRVVMLNIVMLNVIMLNVIMLTVIMINVIMLSANIFANKLRLCIGAYILLIQRYFFTFQV